jgi:hypothetical protein
MLLSKPKTCNSQITTTITTTPFKMLLMVDCMGMKRLTSQSKTPTTISVSKTCINGTAFSCQLDFLSGIRITG